jgi:biopolymer transport protein ExbB
MLKSVAFWFNEGGSFMWVLLVVAAIAGSVAIERMLYYFVFCRTNGMRMVADIAKALNANTIADAKKIARRQHSPVNALVSEALDAYEAGQSIDEIQEAIEERSIKEVPKLSVRLNYLSLFANIATLLGLLGTITGMQVSFSALAAVEAAKKSSMLAKGIAEAMNCTAFGLIVAVTCMVMYTFLSNKKELLVKELDESVIRLLSYLKKKRA